VADESREFVTLRAGRRCEYCQIHQSLQGTTFHLEHIIPRILGGSSELGNLALACPSCNLHKADRTSASNSSNGEVIPFLSLLLLFPSFLCSTPSAPFARYEQTPKSGSSMRRESGLWGFQPEGIWLPPH